jgi:hypothetical protein
MCENVFFIDTIEGSFYLMVSVLVLRSRSIFVQLWFPLQLLLRNVAIVPVFTCFLGALDIPETEKRLFLAEVADNPLLQLQAELSSAFKVEQCIKKNPAFKYIEPLEYKIKIEDLEEPQELKYVYISIPETLAKVAAALETLPVDVRTSADSPELIRDVKDGRAYKENPYFSKFPESFTLMAYTDSVEIANPLGPKKGVYKIVNLYWTIAELPKYLRSKPENWFLALSVKESDLKRHRDLVYKPVSDDFCRLEKGILTTDGKFLRAGLLCYIGDNLESHLVGGFSPVFSSRDVCRTCHIQYEELPNITGNDLLLLQKTFFPLKFVFLVLEILPCFTNFRSDLLKTGSSSGSRSALFKFCTNFL